MFETTELKLLLIIAEGSGGATSTVALAERVGVSQQSVSRLLQVLSDEELIRKRPLTKGLELTLTGKGRMALRSLHARIGKRLGATAEGLRGIVAVGLGEGKYYLSMDEYKRPLAELLGKEPYPGTLNITVDPEERAAFLALAHPIEIPGFQTHKRAYGGVWYYHARISNRDCGLIIPQRSAHGNNKIELVDSAHLRSVLRLRDGDTVMIEHRRVG